MDDSERASESRINAESFDPHTFPLLPEWFKRPASIHGISHTRRVLIHSHAIAPLAGLDPHEFESLVHAVTWHDIGRTHDGWDRKHGTKSVTRVRSLGLDEGIERQILECVFFVMESHSIADEAAVKRASALPATHRDSYLQVLWVLKDADGLDRVRIDDLDPEQLRYPGSRDRVGLAWELLAEMP